MICIEQSQIQWLTQSPVHMYEYNSNSWGDKQEGASTVHLTLLTCPLLSTLVVSAVYSKILTTETWVCRSATQYLEAVLMKTSKRRPHL